MKLIFQYILFTIFLFPSIAMAEYIEPGDVEVKTVRYRPGALKKSEGTYVYRVSWQGIPVAKASVSVQDAVWGVKPALWVQAFAKTVGPVKLFYNLDHKSESVLNPKNYVPKFFRTDEKINSKKRGRLISFKEGGKIHSRRWKEGRYDKKLNFISDNFTLDPISAAMLARSLPIKIGKEFTFDVYNGKHRYMINFDVVKKEKIRITGKKR